MLSPGRVRVAVDDGAGRAPRLDVSLERPEVGALLAGRMPQDAVRLMPLLFSVCGMAQAHAAGAALAAARGMTVAPAPAAMWREAALEHARRLCIDWPAALGLPADAVQVRRLAAGIDGADTQPDALEVAETALFGCRAVHLLDGAPLEGSCGQLLETLAGVEGPGGTGAHWPCGWLVPQDALDFAQAVLDGADPARPVRGAETGPVARWFAHAAVQDNLVCASSRTATRLVARCLELAALLIQIKCEDTVPGRMPPRTVTHAVTPSPGTGVAVVETARGLLTHAVRLEGGRVARFAVIAPTSWNFHPAGPLARSTGWQALGHEARVRAIEREALSLDPCVACVVESGTMRRQGEACGA